MAYRRVAVVGGPGSGKTTTAGEIASALGVPHVELDALWWQPGWTASSVLEFRRQVGAAMAEPGWVIEGNYFDEVAGLVWPKADVLVWLDLPRHLCVRRTLGRTIGRVGRREELWNGNHQSLGALSPASVRRLIRNWPDYPKRTQQLIDQLRPAQVARLRTGREVRRWLAQLSY